MPVKVEQVNEYLFSDTVQSKKTKSDSDEISQGQYRGYPSSINKRNAILGIVFHIHKLCQKCSKVP